MPLTAKDSNECLTSSELALGTEDCPNSSKVLKFKDIRGALTLYVESQVLTRDGDSLSKYKTTVKTVGVTEVINDADGDTPIPIRPSRK